MYDIAATIYSVNHSFALTQYEIQRFLSIFIIDRNASFLSSRTRFGSYIDNTMKTTRQKFIQKSVEKIVKIAIAKFANLITNDKISVLIKLIRVFVEK